MTTKSIQQIAAEIMAGRAAAPSVLTLRVPAARETLRLLLQAALGDGAQWVEGYDDVAAWLGDSRGRGLLLIGGCGLGKTLLATRILPPLVRAVADRVLHYIPARALATAEGLRAAEYHRLKVIDDLGTEQEYNDFGVRRLAFPVIVDRAEQRGDFLVITTNLTAGQLQARYGERTIDRLRALCQVVVLRGDSLRAKMNERKPLTTSPDL